MPHFFVGIRYIGTGDISENKIFFKLTDNMSTGKTDMSDSPEKKQALHKFTESDVEDIRSYMDKNPKVKNTKLMDTCK